MSTQINSKLRSPIENDHYGFRFGEKDFQGRLHPGVDLNGKGAGAADKGTLIYPIAPGVVTFISPLGKRNFGWGNMIFVKHDMGQYFLSFGVDRPSWCPEFVWSQYAHLETVKVKVGDDVDHSEPIATLGGSGGWSPHLHHEIRKRPLGVWFYPSRDKSMEWLNKNYFNPDEFVSLVNGYISSQLITPPETITSRLIKGEKQAEVYVFNGSKRFHIPDEETALFLFNPDWAEEIQEIKIKLLKAIPEGDPLPSMR